MHLLLNIIFATCFIPTLAVSLPTLAQDTAGRAEAYREDSYNRPEKSTIPARQGQEYYVARRWGHDVRKRKREHCIGYNAGECLLVPVAIVGYALQGYNGGSTSPVPGEILGGALGLLGIGVGIMYLGSRHEAHHPQKFLPQLAAEARKNKRGK